MKKSKKAALMLAVIGLSNISSVMDVGLAGGGGREYTLQEWKLWWEERF